MSKQMAQQIKKPQPLKTARAQVKRPATQAGRRPAPATEKQMTQSAARQPAPPARQAALLAKQAAPAANQPAPSARQAAPAAIHPAPLAALPPDAVSLERHDLLLREVQMRKERNKVRRKYLLMIFISFLFAIALIYRYSFVIEINELILKEREALVKLENENSLLQKQIGIETDLETIRLLAESKLDMQKPDRDQIIYIKVPKKDHALVAPPEKQRSADLSNPITYLIGQAKLIQKRLIAD